MDISTIVDSAVTPRWSKTTTTAISIICITETIDIDKVRLEKDTLHMQNYIYLLVVQPHYNLGTIHR